MNAHDTGLSRLDVTVNRWLSRYSIPLLRMSLGIVFLIFGVLKFFPDASPAQDLAERTMNALTFGLIPGSVGIYLVAAMETTIGLCLTTGKHMRLGLALLAMAMVGVLSPIVLFPHELFPKLYAPTLTGQYVIKDIVLLAAGLVVTAYARGARIVAPEPAASAPRCPERRGWGSRAPIS